MTRVIQAKTVFLDLPGSQAELLAKPCAFDTLPLEMLETERRIGLEKVWNILQARHAIYN